MIQGFKVLLAGVVVVACSLRAQAAATLTLYDGVNPLIAIADNGSGDLVPLTGELFVQTNVGVWYLSISLAVTKPILGSTTDPIMDLQITANSSAAGSLRLILSDSDFGPASGILNATMTGHVVSGAPVNQTYDVYGDPANVVGATTVHIASTGTTPMPTTATGSGVLALATPFSLTQVVEVDAFGATSLSGEASFHVVVPEPGTVGLGALGLMVLGLRRVGRKQS